MKSSLFHRGVALVTSMLLVSSMVAFVAPVATSACENQVKLSGVAHGYDIDDDRWIDGVVTNDTSQTLSPSSIMISWPGHPHAVVADWLDCTPIAPGAWVSFHYERPDGVSAEETAVVEATAYPTDTDDKPLAITVTNVSDASTDDDGVRWYTVDIENDNDVPVSSVDAQAIEKDATDGTFAYTLDSSNVPDTLAPGDTAQILFSSGADDLGDLAPDVRVTALEQPQLSLALDTNTPCYGRGTKLTIALATSDGTPAEGCRSFTLMVSDDGDEWDDYRCYDSQDGTVTARIAPDHPVYVKAVYWGGDDLGYAESDAILVTPKVAKCAPSAPGTVHAHHKFVVSGDIDAGAKDRSKSVQIYEERRKGSGWANVAIAKVSADSAGHYSKSLSLSSAGAYRLRAYRAGVGYTPYRSLKVTK